MKKKTRTMVLTSLLAGVIALAGIQPAAHAAKGAGSFKISVIVTLPAFPCQPNCALPPKAAFTTSVTGSYHDANMKPGSPGNFEITNAQLDVAGTYSVSPDCQTGSATGTISIAAGKGLEKKGKAPDPSRQAIGGQSDQDPDGPNPKTVNGVDLQGVFAYTQTGSAGAFSAVFSSGSIDLIDVKHGDKEWHPITKSISATGILGFAPNPFEYILRCVLGIPGPLTVTITGTVALTN